MRKELSPFFCRFHMVYDTTTEGFIFMGGVGGVQEAVVNIVHIHTSETVLRFFHFNAIKKIRSFPDNTREIYILRLTPC